MKRRITFRDKQTSLQDSNMMPEDDSVGQYSSNEIDILAITRSFFRNLPKITGLMLVVSLLTIAFLFSIPNRYQSTATILPSGKTSDFSALKAVVGMGSFGTSDENSSAIFPVILQSRHVRRALLEKRYKIRTDTVQEELSLTEYFEESDPDKLQLALASITDVTTDNRTGEIILSVETQYPTLSQALALEYIDQLEKFNLYKRKSAAKGNEEYLATQVENSSTELKESEERLKEFCLSHRDWAISTNPIITTDLARLKRDVELRSTTYLFLQQQYEVARFEAQKDLPIVRLLDKPSLPTMKSGPFRLKLLIIVMSVTLFVIFAYIIFIDSLRFDTNNTANDISEQLVDDFKDQYPQTHRFYSHFKSKSKKIESSELTKS